jgi:peptidoglycan hydrolase-like protein with peptidoglycan-binding domain
LAARDLYSGRINGQMDRSTRRAVRRFQVGEDLDSAILSMAGARKLGLIAVPREDLVEG